MTELKLDFCTYEAAKYAVERWHYSRRMTRYKSVQVGVWEDTKFVGAVVFGNGANAGMYEPYGLEYGQGAELVRIALSREHKTPVSRIGTIALKFLKKACPGIRLVISFADPEQGHHGGIYQAMNWIYAGMTDPADEYIVNGRRVHGRALRKTRENHKLGHVKSANVYEWARKVLDAGAIKVSGSSKHRYLMPLDDELRARLEKLRQAYPKRTKDQASAFPR